MGNREILLVDENAPIIPAIGFVLQGNGHVVMLAPDARAAFQEVENYHFDLILVSLAGHEGDKFDLVRRAKRRSPRPKVMVVGNPRRMTMPIEAIESEVDDYLLAPFSAPELCTRVDRCLGRNEALKFNPEEKADTINERVLNSLKFKIRDIHNTLFALHAQMNIFMDENQNLLNNYSTGKISDISNDILKMMSITEEFLYNFLICDDENEINEMKKFFLNRLKIHLLKKIIKITSLFA